MNRSRTAAGFRVLALTLAGAFAVAVAHAADLSIRFGAIATEPLQMERTAPLTGPGVKPTKGAFAVILITDDGTLPAEELASARSAAEQLTQMLLLAARQKYGADVPIANEIVVTSAGEANAHRERLGLAGFTFINRTSVPTKSQTVGFEGFGQKEFAPNDVLGAGAISLVLEARPTITNDGSIRLNVAARAGATRVTSSAAGADRAAVNAALERLKVETVQQANGMLLAINQRAWVLTARDRAAVIAGAVPLQKAVPVPLFDQTLRLKLTIPAELQFTGEVAVDPSWEFSL